MAALRGWLFVALWFAAALSVPERASAGAESQVSIYGEAQACTNEPTLFACGPDVVFNTTETGTFNSMLEQSESSTYFLQTMPGKVVASASADGEASASYTCGIGGFFCLDAGAAARAFIQSPINHNGSTDYAGAEATASLSDTMYFYSGLGRAYVEFTGFCVTDDVSTECQLEGQPDYEAFVVPFQDGVPIVLYATISSHATGGFGFNSDTAGEFVLGSISVLDSNRKPVSSFLFYDQSGTPYPTVGGTFIPEPPPLVLSLAGLGAIFVLMHRSHIFGAHSPLANSDC